MRMLRYVCHSKINPNRNIQVTKVLIVVLVVIKNGLNVYLLVQYRTYSDSWVRIMSMTLMDKEKFSQVTLLKICRTQDAATAL